MPRILSRNSSLYKRGGSSGSQSAFSRRYSFRQGASSSSSSSDEALFASTSGVGWGYAASAASSQSSSAASSVASSPSARNFHHRKRAIFPMHYQSSDGYGSSEDAPASARRLSAGPRQQQDETDGSWGHFIDTAEAEAEIIRHSKILSKRSSMR